MAPRFTPATHGTDVWVFISSILDNPITGIHVGNVCFSMFIKFFFFLQFSIWCCDNTEPVVWFTKNTWLVAGKDSVKSWNTLVSTNAAGDTSTPCPKYQIFVRKAGYCPEVSVKSSPGAFLLRLGVLRVLQLLLKRGIRRPSTDYSDSQQTRRVHRIQKHFSMCVQFLLLTCSQRLSPHCAAVLWPTRLSVCIYMFFGDSVTRGTASDLSTSNTCHWNKQTPRTLCITCRMLVL